MPRSSGGGALSAPLRDGSGPRPVPSPPLRGLSLSVSPRAHEHFAPAGHFHPHDAASPRHPAAHPPSPGGGGAYRAHFDGLGRQPNLDEVQTAVRRNPGNALGIIQEASGRECAYGWHTRRYQTQYVPVEVEKVKVVDRPVEVEVPHPVPDPTQEHKVRQLEKEVDRLRTQPPVLVRDDATRRRDKLSLKAQNERLLAKLHKKDEDISDLRLALHRNFAIAKDLNDLGRPEIVEVKRAAEHLLQGKTVHLREALRHKEQYIQEVTQALLDCSSYVLRIQREVQEVLRTERVESGAAWEETRRLEERTRSLEKELLVVPSLRAQLRESEAVAAELRQQLDDKDDVIEALEEQFRQAQLDEGNALSRDEVLVRMTQLRFKIALKNAGELQSKAELLRYEERLKSSQDDVRRAEEDAEEQRAECERLRTAVDALQLQMAELRRDLLTASAPVRPLVMPPAVYDDELRLLEAPAAPRTRPLSDQDIVAAFALFDASTQGELPEWDMPTYLRALGFTADDPAVRRLMADFRHKHGTLTLEEFRDVLHALQREYAPLRNSALHIILQWQDASKRRIKAHKRRMQESAGGDGGGGRGDDSDGSDAESPYQSIATISIRALALTPGDIEAAFDLFDFDMAGELDRKDVGTFVSVLGLVRTDADLEALKVMVDSEFTGVLNLVEWGDVVQHCQGLQPNFLRRRVLEMKPPKRRIYPRPFPRAGRTHPLSEREVDCAFRLFNVDNSGLLPGHLVPTYLETLGLVCNGHEFTALLVTQYKVDLTQKVTHQYFHRIVRFVQTHLEFFHPSPRPPKLRSPVDDPAECARRQQPFLAPPVPPPQPAPGGAARSGGAAPPSRPSTAAFSPRTRHPGQHPPWMEYRAGGAAYQPGHYPPWKAPSAVPAPAESIERDEKDERTAAGISATAEAEGARRAEDSPVDASQALPGDAVEEERRGAQPQAAATAEIIEAFRFFTKLFNCPQVAMATGSTALALPHVCLACRALGYMGVTKRKLEQIWPYERKMDAAQRKAGGGGDELILDENQFVRLVRNIERGIAALGEGRRWNKLKLPKTVNRLMHGGAIRPADIQHVFDLIDDEEKKFLKEKAEFRMLLDLIGFTFQDQPEIQNVIVAFDRRRPSRTSRENKIFELGDCVEVIEKLTSKPQSCQTKEFNPTMSFM